MVVDDKDEEWPGEEGSNAGGEIIMAGGSEEDGFVLRSLTIRLPVHLELFTISAGRRKGPLPGTERAPCAYHELFYFFFFFSILLRNLFFLRELLRVKTRSNAIYMCIYIYAYK
jgi:hypothetical protein